MRRMQSDLGLYGMMSLVLFGRIMLYMNSAGNPILYNMLSTKFRKAFKKALCPRCYETSRLERRLTLSTYIGSGRHGNYYHEDEPATI